MRIVVAHHKGGVGKTTTAIHLAAFLQTKGPTVLVDGDSTRTATKWAKRGPGTTFRVIDETADLPADAKHIVFDTGQKIGDDELRDLTSIADFVVVPAVPAAFDTDGLIDMLKALASLQGVKHRVLIMRVPPPPVTDGEDLRADLAGGGVALFKTMIPELRSFKKAALSGVTVDQVKGDRNAKRAWASFEAAAKEMMRYAK